MEQTTKLDLFKPDYGDEADIEFLNNNADQLDMSIGVTSVDRLQDITDPYKHQFAYETSTNKLFFWTPEIDNWILVAIGDPTSPNPYRIVIPSKPEYDVTLTSTENPLQLGVDGGVNMVLDNNEIQGRDGQGGPNAIAINVNGGHVTLGGPNKGLIEGEAGGVYIPSMVPKRQSISTNIMDYRSTSWTKGGSNTCEIEIVAHYACRFMVFMTVSVQANHSSCEGVFTVGAVGSSGYIEDPNNAPEERLVRFTGTHKQQVALNYFFDPPTSHRGKKITIAIYHKAAAAMSEGNGFNIYTRRLHVLPVT